MSSFVSSSTTSALIAGAVCGIGIAVLRKLSSRELQHLRAEAAQAAQSSDDLAEQLKAERAAAAELAKARDLQLAEVAELKAQLVNLTAKLESLGHPGSAERSKAPGALHVAGEIRAASRGQLTPVSTERKWNAALLRSSLFSAEASSEDANGSTSLAKPKKLAL